VQRWLFRLLRRLRYRLSVTFEPEVLERTEQNAVVVKVYGLTTDQVRLLAEDTSTMEGVGVDPLAVFAVVAQEDQGIVMMVFDKAVDGIS